MTLRGLSGKTYQLAEKPFSSGGEGGVFSINGMPDIVVKVYHGDRVTQELEQKLLVMYNHPPSREVFTQIAWPVDLVYDSNGIFQGFVMHRLNITDELNAIYSYPPKKNISYKAKIIIAQNICAVISEIHKAGFVFGDFNPKNIGIDLGTCRVAFLDTDSYHIVDGSRTYRCKVCLDGYVAPELLKKCEPYKTDAYAQAPLPTFTKETDNFALAIHIFRLLMNGYTPFNGIPENQSVSTASPGTGNQAIKRDNYCFKTGNKPQSVAVPPLSVLPKSVSDLFTRAFILGKLNPARRPTAVEWHEALLRYEDSLTVCFKNPAHLYQAGLSACPWCEADERYAASIAEPPASARTGPTLPQKTFQGAVVTVVSAPAVQAPPPPRPPIPPPPPPGPPIPPPPPSGYGTPSVHSPGSGGSSGSAQGKEKKRKSPLRTLRTVAVLIVVVFAVSTVYKMVSEGHRSGQYAQAEGLLKAGSYDEAIAIFQELKDYSDAKERVLDTKYQKAEALLEAGNKPAAAVAFGVLGAYQDARERSFSLWDEVAVRETIAAGPYHAAALKEDGTVVAAGRDINGSCAVEDWADIIAVSVGRTHTVGLKADGTVVATGENQHFECDVAHWTDIVAISAGYWETIGLKADGTVVSVGRVQDNISSWTDIVAVSAYDTIIGLKADGTVVAADLSGAVSIRNELDRWTDIVAVSTHESDFIGLRADGTVVAAGHNNSGELMLSEWEDIVAISNGSSYTVGLKSDGTLVTAGSYGIYRHMESWTNIVAISAGYGQALGLKSDGTVLAGGDFDVSGWFGIKVPGK